MEQTKANTEVSEFKIIDDEKNTPTLKEAQDFVGGMVECITFPNGDLLIVNEEGKLMQLTFKSRSNSAVENDIH